MRRPRGRPRRPCPGRRRGRRCRAAPRGSPRRCRPPARAARRCEEPARRSSTRPSSSSASARVLGCGVLLDLGCLGRLSSSRCPRGCTASVAHCCLSLRVRVARRGRWPAGLLALLLGSASWAAGAAAAGAPRRAAPARRPRRRTGHAVRLAGLAPCRVALLLGRRGRRARGRVVADHVELLAHRPQVGGGPVEEHADRERDATDREHHRAARRAASSAAGRTGRSARRPACSCSSAGAGSGTSSPSSRPPGSPPGSARRHAAVGEERRLERHHAEELGVAEALGQRVGQEGRRRRPWPRGGRAAGTAPGRSASGSGSAGTRRTGWCPLSLYSFIVSWARRSRSWPYFFCSSLTLGWISCMLRLDLICLTNSGISAARITSVRPMIDSTQVPPPSGSSTRC